MIGWIGPHRDNGTNCLQPEQMRDDAEAGSGSTRRVLQRGVRWLGSVTDGLVLTIENDSGAFVS